MTTPTTMHLLRVGNGGAGFDPPHGPGLRFRNGGGGTDGL